MRVGVPTEIKNNERRVGLTPTSVREVIGAGHDVVVQPGAGASIGASDRAYIDAGASIAPLAADVFTDAEMIVKVKEPQAEERAMMRRDHILFTYLHLAPDPDQTTDLVASGAMCIAYETVTDDQGRLPLLAPMSQVAGRMSIQAGATALEATHGGAGLLMGGVPGVAPARVVVIGGGVVGKHATEIAIGMGADVTVIDRNLDVLNELDSRFDASVTTLYSTADALEDSVLHADLVIGAVLVKGARAPRLVTADMVRDMRAGSVLVDVAIDQGGAFETSHATTHENPTYIVDEVVHYCVANMPGGVPRTSTYALNNATLPFVIRLANGPHSALIQDRHVRSGLNVMNGQVTELAVAQALGFDYVEPLEALKA
jgi:alanine dehydrogenase